MKDLTKIGEFEVVERVKARVGDDDPSAQSIPNMIGKEISTVDEVLLSNETIVFQCAHPNDEDCTYTAQSARSVTAHQRAHGDKTMAKKALERAQAAEQELAERIQRRSNGSRKAAQTRKNARATVPAEIGNETQSRKPIGDPNLAKAAQNVITAFNAMQACADEFQKVLIGYMRAVQTASESVQIDPQIIAKAKAYDDLKKKLFEA